MGKKLLITEKPSVAMEFAKALKANTTRRNGYLESSEYIITWCVGHLVTMSYPEVYDEKYRAWRYDTLPFIPNEWKYEVIESVKNQFDTVKALLLSEDVDTIYVCTDSGREGEYIYRLVDEMVKVQGKSKKRVWIDSQTEEEIIKGITNAKDLSEYDSLSDSAYLRAKEDYLIGINFSRLLTLSYGKEVAERNNEERTSISVGRVMTCVLGMIVDREYEIINFKKSKFYKIGATFEEGLAAEWKCDKENTNNIDIVKNAIERNLIYNDNGFKNENDATSFCDYIKNFKGDAIVTESSKKTIKENAPLLYNLAEIQNECSKRFKISPDQTLENIQLLYEKKLVTYPRTDARVISTAVAKEIRKNLNGLVKGYKDDEVQAILKQMIDEKYSIDIIKSKYVNDSKITDHYALIPTGQGFENYDALSPLQKNIYKLIVKRFISIFFPPAEFLKLAVTIDIDGQKFYSNAKVCVKQGYLDVIKNDKSSKNDKITNSDRNESLEKVEDNGIKAENNYEDSENNTISTNIEMLKKMKKGQKLTLADIKTKEGETSPPSRYTSGSIILAMENAGKLIEDEKLREQIKGSGIGTSATRAEIIKKLNRIGYIDINTKTQVLSPSKKGELVYKVVKFTIPDMLNPELTASWEKGLDMVAKKEIEKDIFMQKLEKYIVSRVDRVKGARY